MDVGRFDISMPRGTAALALGYARRAADAAARVTGTVFEVSENAVLAHLLLPMFVGDLTASRPPRPVAGGGWVHADLIPGDEALFAVLAEDGSAADAEELARVAQECRLPVTPYRAVPAPWVQPPGMQVADISTIAPSELKVIDMTAMWAGPLCTALLAEWGADVVTVEPPSRLDGLRASPAQFAALDRGKRRQPWDLRAPADRAAFELAVAEADVLVESFSARVLPNLGYDPATLTRLNPDLTTVRIRAFPGGSAEGSWVAYGRGVHAASGLGMVSGWPAPAAVAYPDPLAGLLAFAVLVEALGAPRSRPRELEISLASAIAPLLGTAGTPLGPSDEEALAWLRARAEDGRPGRVLVQR